MRVVNIHGVHVQTEERRKERRVGEEDDFRFRNSDKYLKIMYTSKAVTCIYQFDIVYGYKRSLARFWNALAVKL